MTKRIQRIVPFAVFGLLSVSSASRAIATEHLEPGQTFSLANGAALSFMGATYGTSHKWPSAFGVDRDERITPGSGYPLAGPYLVVWLKRESHFSSYSEFSLAFAFLVDSRSRYADEDDMPVGFRGISDSRATWLRFIEVPKRPPRLTLQFYSQRSGSEELVVQEFTFSNPAFQDWPRWDAEELPITQSNDDLDCTLHSLVTGRRPQPKLVTTERGPQVELHVDNFSHPGAFALFEFHERGFLTGDWSVVGINLKDATQNSKECNRLYSDYLLHGAESIAIIGFRPILQPAEIWDMTVRAKRTADARFSEDEIIICPQVVVPERGATNRLDQTFTRRGLEVTVESLTHLKPREPLKPLTAFPLEGRGHFYFFAHQLMESERPIDIWLSNELSDSATAALRRLGGRASVMTKKRRHKWRYLPISTASSAVP